MERSRAVCALVSLVAGLIALASGSASAQNDIVREGVGDRRTQLDKMELTDFDQSLWSGLTDWTNDGPVTPALTEGKVVLIYTWSSFLPTAVRPMPVVNRLAQQYGDRGLVVVGVHNDEGWEDAEKVAQSRHATFPIARDKGNKFRAALKVDQDPDFYLIDRSGRLRYADIETASVERAVSTLIDESVSDAQTLLERRAEAKANAAAEARRTEQLRSRINLAELPWPDFPQPSEDAYNAAEWPKMDTGGEDSRGRRRRDAPTGPVSINWNKELTWEPNFPEHTAGRLTLVYLFDPTAITEWSRGGHTIAEAFRAMDQVQASHSRDLLVVGEMVNPTPDDNRRRRGDEDNQMKPEQVAENFRKMMAIPVNHYRVSDIGGTVIAGRLSPNNGEQGRGRGSREGFVLPYFVLVSSDGVVRWHGSITTSENAAAWQAALDTMLKVDPGLIARRSAEEAYIKSITE
ncbi:MAG: TlpA family protein disulfide reductase [Phycisphaeraceae bacterium]|nr:MAG: TlpA family protein disulfide reductase [Phycisphaeraceae bacterium]